MGIDIQINEKIIRTRSTDQSFLRGKSYYHNGAVKNPLRRGQVLEALCEGSKHKPYHIHVYLNDAGAVDDATCTCDYSFEGDCKHIVAVLLLLLHEPESFEVHPVLDDVLAQRTPGELIALIRQMVDRYPDLQVLIDRPIPGKTSRGTPLKVDSYVKELRSTLRSYEGWGDDTPVQAIRSIARDALQFARAGDWKSASAIYRAVLAEGMREDYQMFDDEGDFYGALSELLPDLVECLEPLKEEDHERQAILYALLDAVIRDVQMGGIGYSDTLEEDVLYRYARQSDVPELRRRIDTARDRAQGNRYNTWQMENYEEMLAQLDLLDAVDPEVTLQRLRDHEQWLLLLDRLLKLARVPEALEVVREHLTAGHELLRGVQMLDQSGQTDAALTFVLARLKREYNRALVDWLLSIYQQRGDHDACYEWQHKRMLNEPALDVYRELKSAAATVGKWEALRPQILKGLDDRHQFALLIDIYLEDHEWANAWATLPRIGRTEASGWQYTAVDLKLARTTCTEFPEQALPVYLKYVQKAIDRRSRDDYREAAELLQTTRELYGKLNQEAEWETLITRIRSEYKRLTALQDELKKAQL